MIKLLQLQLAKAPVRGVGVIKIKGAIYSTSEATTNRFLLFIKNKLKNKKKYNQIPATIIFQMSEYVLQ